MACRSLFVQRVVGADSVFDIVYQSGEPPLCDPAVSGEGACVRSPAQRANAKYDRVEFRVLRVDPPPGRPISVQRFVVSTPSAPLGMGSIVQISLPGQGTAGAATPSYPSACVTLFSRRSDVRTPKPLNLLR